MGPSTRWKAAICSDVAEPSASITVEPLEAGIWSRGPFRLEFQGKGIGKLVPDVVRQLALKGAPKSYQHLKERLERGDWRAGRRAGAMPPANREGRVGTGETASYAAVVAAGSPRAVRAVDGVQHQLPAGGGVLPSGGAQ